MDRHFLHALAGDDEFHTSIRKDSGDVALAAATAILGNNSRWDAGYAGYCLESWDY